MSVFLHINHCHTTYVLLSYCCKTDLIVCNSGTLRLRCLSQCRGVQCHHWSSERLKQLADLHKSLGARKMNCQLKSIQESQSIILCRLNEVEIFRASLHYISAEHRFLHYIKPYISAHILRVSICRIHENTTCFMGCPLKFTAAYSKGGWTNITGMKGTKCHIINTPRKGFAI